ncbi:MAG: hypothetical protein ACP5FH_04055 [Terracidiphilus sp.]
METNSILSQIDAEIAKLMQVRSLLAAAGKSSIEEALRKIANSPSAAKTKTGAKERRQLSPEARQRIVDAQHRRWAAQKASQKASQKAAQKARKS